jgi:hypothetical protein
MVTKRNYDDYRLTMFPDDRAADQEISSKRLQILPIPSSKNPLLVRYAHPDTVYIEDYQLPSDWMLAHAVIIPLPRCRSSTWLYRGRK